MKLRNNPESPLEIQKEISVRQEFLKMIKYGRKTMEVRIAYPDLDGISAGDHIRFRSSRDEVIVRVKAVRRRRSISEIIEKENISKIAPQVPQIHLRQLARQLFSESHIEKHGLLAIEFEVIEA
jgi:ASC-1-like (ASCH) protein